MRQVFIAWAVVVGLSFLLFGCGGGGDDEPPKEEIPKYHVPPEPDLCTTTYPCQPK